MRGWPPEGEVIIEEPLCPECGSVIKSFSFEAKKMIKVPNVEELWPGGPVVHVPGEARYQYIADPQDYRAWPCGHFVPGDVLRWKTAPDPTGLRQ